MLYALLESINLMLLYLAKYEQKAIGRQIGGLEDYFGIAMQSRHGIGQLQQAIGKTVYRQANLTVQTHKAVIVVIIYERLSRHNRLGMHREIYRQAKHTRQPQQQTKQAQVLQVYRYTSRQTTQLHMQLCNYRQLYISIAYQVYNQVAVI